MKSGGEGGGVQRCSIAVGLRRPKRAPSAGLANSQSPISMGSKRKQKNEEKKATKIDALGVPQSGATDYLKAWPTESPFAEGYGGRRSPQARAF